MESPLISGNCASHLWVIISRAHPNKETAKQRTVSVFMMSDNWESSFSLQKEPIIIKTETIEIVTVTGLGLLRKEYCIRERV